MNTFTDNTYSLAKGIQYTNMARLYFEDAGTGTQKEIKAWFQQISHKLNWIIDSVKYKLNDKQRETFKVEISDSLAFESISDKLNKISTSQRLLIETILDGMIAGEDVKIMDEVCC
jgi:hypothetical protein